MATQRFNVFTKTKKTADGNTFKVYLTKNDNGVTYEVRFTQECEGLKMLQKADPAFVLVADSSNLSLSHKKVRSKNEDNKYYDKFIIYVRSIRDIEEYVEPEFDVDAFNSVKNDRNTDEELPF